MDRENDFKVGYAQAMHTGSKLGTILSAGFVIIAIMLILMNIQVFVWWRKARHSTCWICFAAVVNIVVVSYFCIQLFQVGFCLLVHFKFATITATFALLAFSEYLVLLTATLLVTNLRNPGSNDLNRKLRWVLIPLHILFAVSLVCGVAFSLGAYCSSRFKYPINFFIQAGLLVLLLVFSIVMRSGFGLKWRWPADMRKQFGTMKRAAINQFFFE